MCGISGYWSKQQHPEQVLVTMNNLLVHRGPDAEGFYRDGPVALGHRRLSILDIEGSPQPMTSGDAQATIVFNGEIYNFPELREELLKLGHPFKTHGDTEVLLTAYQAWGLDLLQHIRGMFAFAIWDKREQRLFMARDHVGVKPFYYAWDGQSLAFGSELKAVAAFPGVRREVNLDAIGSYLECQYIPSPQTIYTGIHKLPAAHCMVLEKGELKQWRYWSPDYAHKLEMSESEAVEALDRELRDSVRGMLLSDVPLGCFLSGGIDSSMVAALMTDITGKPVETFNLGFSGEVRGSEHEYAQMVARHIGSNHHPLMIDTHNVLDSLSDMTRVFDEPFGDQAALPTMLLSQLTRRHVTVALTGEGADEIFCGYSNYGKRVDQERITRIWGSNFSPIRHLVPFMPPLLRRQRLIKAMGEPLSRRYTTIPSLFDQSLQKGLFTQKFYAAQHSCLADAAEAAFEECNSASYLEKLMHVDMRLWLQDDLLNKVDKASMAHSLEARVPFLDHHFLEFCAKLDPQYKLQGDSRKYLLKRLAERYLPKEIVYRSKQGFVMPLSEWLAGQLKDTVLENLSGNGLARRGLIRPEALERLTRKHYDGSKNNSGRLWSLFMLENWFQRYEPDFTL